MQKVIAIKHHLIGLLALLAVLAVAGCTAPPGEAAPADQSNREQTQELKDHISGHSMPLKKLTIHSVELELDCEYTNRSRRHDIGYATRKIVNPLQHAGKFVEYPDARVIITNPFIDEGTHRFERPVDWCFDQEDAEADLTLAAVSYDVVGFHGNRTVLNETATCRPYVDTEVMDDEYAMLDTAALADWVHDACLPVEWKPPKEGYR